MSGVSSQISQMGERRFENPQTMNLQSVLSACTAVHQLLAERGMEQSGTVRGNLCVIVAVARVVCQPFSERLLMLWGRLQAAVNVVMDSSQEKKKAMPNGIKQVMTLSLCSRTNPYGREACHLCLLG